MSRDSLIKLTKLINDNNLDGYIVPKNDNFFTEQVKYDRLKLISNFSGSAGLAVILKKKNYLFVDSRYTIQAKLESGTNFKIIKIHEKLPKNQFKNITLGYDPNLFTYSQLEFFFGKKIKLQALNKNLIDEIIKIKKIVGQPFYSLPNNVTGMSYKRKINLISNYIKRKKADFLFISSPENIAWLLNIRGTDTPFSPLPNCSLVLKNNKRFYLIAEKYKAKKLLLEKKISLSQIIEKDNLDGLINNLKGSKFIIDNKTLSISKENKIRKKFSIISREDPCYFYKSKKNSTEIKNMIQSHIADGTALTKFIFWIKNLKNKKITEIDAEKKLESLRKKK